MSEDNKDYDGLKPNQVSGLEAAYKKIETLENEVKKMKADMLTKEEYLKLTEVRNKAFMEELNREGVNLKLTTDEWSNT